MEGIEDIEAELENKSIEKSVQIKEVEAPKKEKKPRSQAQKEAFEKARKKRAENLAKKKAEEKSYVDAVKSNPEPVEDIKPAPKRRGRPKKLTKNQEPPPQSFIPPPDPQLYSQYPYQVQSQAQPHFNPYNYWGGGVQQPAPQPVVNNYYYGEQHHHQAQTNSQQPKQELPRYEPEPSPDGSINDDYDYQDEVEEEEIEYPQSQPQLKYRFA